MFEALSGRFSDIFNRLGRHGVLSEAQIMSALREVRVALLEADVALSVVKTSLHLYRKMLWAKKF